MQWRIITKELRQSVGIGWIRHELEDYDWSTCEWITIRRRAPGKPEGYEYTVVSPISGRCKFPSATKSGKYRINCLVNTNLGWPAYEYCDVQVLYQNKDGTWPEMPEGLTEGLAYGVDRSGRSWKKLYRKMPLNNEDEALVSIIAHEAFHYLNATDQIPSYSSKDEEVEAHAYARGKVEQFRLLMSSHE